MELTFSPAVSEEAEVLKELFIQYDRELHSYEMAYTLDEDSLLSSIQGRIRSKMALAAAARDGEKVVGFIFCNISRLSGYSYAGSPLFGYISDAFVLPEYRSQGAAGRLCDMAMQWLKDNGVDYAELKVLESNHTAHSFWSGRGFEPTTRVYGKKLNGKEDE